MVGETDKNLLQYGSIQYTLNREPRITLHHPIETLRSATKCNTIPEKQHDLLRDKVEYNIIIELLI
jgi:hypothetical protein